MNIFLAFSTLILLTGQGFILWFLFKLHRRIDNIFTVDLPSPNEATKKTSDGIELNEQNALNIPPDVKIELEGDDNVPFGFKPTPVKTS